MGQAANKAPQITPPSAPTPLPARPPPSPPPRAVLFDALYNQLSTLPRELIGLIVEYVPIELRLVDTVVNAHHLGVSALATSSLYPDEFFSGMSLLLSLNISLASPKRMQSCHVLCN